MSGAWGLFAYDALDYTAAQQWLDRKAAQGWRLKKLYFGLLARFERDETSVILCCVAPQGHVQGEEADSCRLCAGTGWDWVAGVRGMDLFVSPPGVFPLPFPSDTALEPDGLFRRVRRRWTASALLILSLLALLGCVLWGTGGMRWSVLLTSDRMLCGLAFAAVDVGLLAAAALSHIHVYIRCRRSVAKGDGLPVRPQRPVRARVLLDYALMLLVWLTCFGSALAWIGGNSLPVERADREELRREPVVLAEDLKIRDGRTSSLSVQEGASLLVSWRRTCEVLRKDGALTGQVRCEVYRCRSVRIARLLAGALYREEREGRPRRLLERHGALELTEAALGFDQAWTGDGPDGSCLLLRQGTTVAVLEAPAELTGADTLEKLWTRLQLEGKAA